MKEDHYRHHLLMASAVVLTLYASSSVSGAEGNHGHEGEPYHKNVIGIFAGVAHADRRGNEAALGLEYERRISEHFGLGAVVEYTFDNADLWIAAIPIAFHTGHWKLFVAPGIEDGHHGKEELLRLGAEYAFELGGGWEIAPQVNVDFVDSDDVWVFGMVFAKGF